MTLLLACERCSQSLAVAMYSQVVFLISWFGSSMRVGSAREAWHWVACSQGNVTSAPGPSLFNNHGDAPTIVAQSGSRLVVSGRGC